MEKTLSTILSKADEARDQNRCAEAAEFYRAALTLVPGRTDISIQMANMLKDSHRFAEAEAIYLEASAEFPANADVLLQLGHVRKLTGRRNEALEDYRKALALDPNLSAARHELAVAGATPEIIDAYKHERNKGSCEALLVIRKRLDDLAYQIAALRRALPDATAAVAFPVEAYDDLRRLYDVPPPFPPENAPLAECLIAIVLHADAAGDLGAFHRQLTAVRNQTQPRWRLIVIGTDPDCREVAERAAANDSRISWTEGGSAPIGLQEREVARASGADWVVFLGRGACLHPQALAWVSAISQRTACGAIVFDEEIGGGGEFAPSLKPVLRNTFDRWTLLEANVWGETLAVCARPLAELKACSRMTSLFAARSELLLSVSQLHSVAHAPLPLVRVDPNHLLAPESAALQHAQAVRAHLDHGPASWIKPREDAPAVLSAIPPPKHPNTEIVVVVPTQNNLLDLKGLVESLSGLAARPESLSILVLNNGGAVYRAQLDAVLAPRRALKITDLDEPFNWSRFNNLGAAMTSAPYLVFANDDMSMLSQGWDEVVRALLERPDVGAVGARLLYPNDTVQHAGMLFAWQGAVIHDGLYEPCSAAGPALRWQVTRSASAVTGAFLATRRVDFEAVGGFDEVNLAISFSDVDYALKLRARGLHILWTPAVTLHHYESKSRGLDHLHPPKVARDDEEKRIMRTRWPGVLDFEPSVNPIWISATLPHRLLSLPSREQIWDYVQAGAAENPWRVGPADSVAGFQSPSKSMRLFDSALQGGRLP